LRRRSQGAHIASGRASRLAREFWRFVVVQKTVAKLASTAIDYPPMQKPATFNLDAVKAQIQEAIDAHSGQ
jgi:hypothetical protein